MSIQGFNPEELARDFANEAMSVVPAEFNEQQKKFVVDILHRYCLLAGNAIVSQELPLDINQAVLICQFIGEWTFHKSIDVIKSGIPAEAREEVLQAVAFAVFEIAKKTQLEGIPQQQAIEIVEQEVKQAYKLALDKLAEHGQLDAAAVDKAMSQSNIDDVSAQMSTEAPPLSKRDEEKLYKTASMALFFRRMPEEKVRKILSKMPVSEAQQIMTFMQMPNLEKQIDPKVVDSMINDFKKHLPGVKNKESKVIAKTAITMVLQKFQKQDVVNVLSKERDEIRNLFENPKAVKRELSVHVADLICRHVDEKLAGQA